MNDQNTDTSLRATERRMLPFAVEFLKFFIIFVVILTIALLTLQLAASVGS